MSVFGRKTPDLGIIKKKFSDYPSVKNVLSNVLPKRQAARLDKKAGPHRLLSAVKLLFFPPSQEVPPFFPKKNGHFLYRLYTTTFLRKGEGVGVGKEGSGGTKSLANAIPLVGAECLVKFRGLLQKILPFHRALNKSPQALDHLICLLLAVKIPRLTPRNKLFHLKPRRVPYVSNDN